MSSNAIRVLLVEDNEDDYVITRDLLAEAQFSQFELEWVATYEAALEAIARQQHDVYLLDYRLGDRNGIELLQKALSNGCQAPIILLTGSSTHAIDPEAMEVGATDFLCKDEISTGILERTIRYAIRQQQLYQQLQTANDELQRLVNVDSLTQLANRRYFDEFLSREWQRSAREQSSLALIMCDIDYFKQFNDTYGHLAGDFCLSQIAQVFQQVVKRPADLVARYGGEEFVILLPNTSEAGAIALAQIILDEVQNLQISHTGSTVANHVTVSLGIATAISNPSSRPEDLIAAADQALYQAKTQGRNRCMIADGQKRLELNPVESSSFLQNPQGV